MNLKQFLTTALLIISTTGFSQNLNKDILFTIDDKPYYTDEFLRVYNKNIDLVKDESQKDLNAYLDLYVAYKLKINKANKLELQNGTQYKNELRSYRNQLAKNYTSDTKVTKALIDEAYTRIQKEVKASHILILCDENATPEDTLKAYKQIQEVRNKALKGESFESLAIQYSQDPSAKENKGNLGYFSAFRMVYPFESAAYKTKIEEISMPVRTRFGYHLLKVQDIRENRGEVTVAHIMILRPQNNTDADIIKSKNSIYDIYSKLKQGENFATLANQYSEDKSSAPKGGTLPRFSSGQLSSDIFEDKAFELKKIGDYSEPFESQFGWHIVKLIEKHPIKKLQEMERELDAKIRKDDRSKIIVSALTSKLRQKYSVKRNEKMFLEIKNIITDSYYNPEWQMPENKKQLFDKELVKIADKSIEGTLFINELNSQQKIKTKIKPIEKLIDQAYSNFIDNQLNIYYNENLEKEFPEFANIVEEYRDGLLLFDLMEKEIWNKAKQDTIGLKKYFQENKLKYQWKNRAEVITVSSTNEEFVKKAQKLLKENATIDVLKEKLNTKEIINVIPKKEIVEEGNNPNIILKEGVTKIYKEKEYFYVTKVLKILPARQKELEETKGKVISDYQQFLEDNWVSELKKEFKVNINNNVFEKLKTSK
ncbi:peptidylprolyl isomerase [Flavobacterium covae]|uniref:Peptidylprolyl isomerase n=1 Tax=Flavobacterium covae TaxID=2906076 RepID=A0ABW8PEV9_9FLAO|nr:MULTISPECIES: peptidylprolyl isomerase [Flavobacterium]AND63303.1 peptidylprolyl isomerase [Flavobacterium covae]OXA75890.1 peptidylprolyl isomerase [Flavobacterium columnare] [Flavobacterium columnare NBRC 100251 = ATCC 23463]POR20792.1 peptidylprolyl isomerase [Flavobacterium columnare]